MKKLNIIFALIISSFFFFSSEIKADTTVYEISQTEVDYLFTEEFIELREKTIEYCNENNMYYYITYLGGAYRSRIFNITNLEVKYSSDKKRFGLYNNVSFSLYKLDNGDLTFSNSLDSMTVHFMSNNVLSYDSFLDTNIMNLNFTSSADFVIKYNDYTVSITQNSHYPSLYEIYSNYESSIEKPEEVNPKAEIISNFYILTIDKIKILSNYIATDYIILSALVIFIFVAVVGLVRRLE